MCGIAGVVARGRSPVAQSDLDHFVLALRHRGPDGRGTWLSDDGSIGLSHTRLAIIDLDERAAQPMFGDDGRVISFNGEIYNYRQLRDELVARGYRFRTCSDTEVVLQAYSCWGEAALERLRGMFAFAIADPARRRVFVARDPFGIKPLYYSIDNESIRFASEVRALERFVDSSVSSEALIDLLTWGNIAAPFTIRSDIQALKPGHCAIIDVDGVHSRRWSRGAAVLDDGDDSATDCDVVEAIEDSVQAHLESDVEVGVFLSSGVDSSVLASLCAAHSPQPLKTLTVRNPDSDETEAAAHFARSIGAEHIVVEFSETHLAAQLDEAVRSLDQPSLDGINSFFVARAAQQAGLKVAISGVGGDELFGGYSNFSRLPRLCTAGRVMRPVPLRGFKPLDRAWSTDWSRSTPRGRVNWLTSYLPYEWGPYLIARAVMSPHEVAGALEISLESVIRRIEERLSREKYRGSKNLVSRMEVDQYLTPQLLRDIDAVSMASALEVRTPLVDSLLYRNVASFPSRLRVNERLKPLLRTASRHALNRTPGRKQGFNVPIERWLGSGTLPGSANAAGTRNSYVVGRLAAEHGAVQRPWTHRWLAHVIDAYLEQKAPA